MAKEVFVVPREEKAKVQQRIREDDLISRQSLTFREIGEKFYLIVEGSEEAIERIEKEFGLEKAEDKEKILEEIKKEEESAMQGFGSIFG